MVSIIIFFCSFLFSAIVDIKKRIIPNTLVIIMFVLSILHNKNVEFIIFGVIAAVLPILLVHLLTKKQNGIGFGDVKLSAVVGAFLGIEVVMVTLLISSVLGAIYAIILHVFKKQQEIPFAPFMFMGVCITMIMIIINKYW